MRPPNVSCSAKTLPAIPPQPAMAKVGKKGEIHTSAVESKDGAPVDVGDAVDGRDGGLDDGVSDDGPDPVELVLLLGVVTHTQVGHRDPHRPVLQGAAVPLAAGVH